jgi:uncharacterized membrane protein YjjB (DUF3815 family)
MSSIALILAGIAAGATTLIGLWFVNPVLCILCAPLVASFLIGLAAILGSRAPKRPRRHGISGYPSAKVQ